jgi:hypothetical protein
VDHVRAYSVHEILGGRNRSNVKVGFPYLI